MGDARGVFQGLQRCAKAQKQVRCALPARLFKAGRTLGKPIAHPVGSLHLPVYKRVARLSC